MIHLFINETTLLEIDTISSKAILIQTEQLADTS
jgi:hypothetical protein